MGTESTTHSNITDENSQSSAPDFERALDQNGQYAGVGACFRGNLGKSEFVKSGTVREELVQMAVSFLSHPTVRGAPINYRRSFLVKKGLTNEEIEEAFHCVPDPPLKVTTSNHEGIELPASSNLLPQDTGQALQPLSVTFGSVLSILLAASRYKFRWSHAILVLGLVAASGAGTALLLKNFILPRLRSWIRKVVFEDDDDTQNTSRLSLYKATTEAANAAAAVNAAKTSLKMLQSKNEERRYFETLMMRLELQAEDLRSMRNLICKRAAREASMPSHKQPEQQYSQDSSKSVKPLSAPASTVLSVGQHPKSNMEVMATIQRRQKSPVINEINDLPSNPNQRVPSSRLAPKIKPWQVAQAHNTSIYAKRHKLSSHGSSTVPWWQRNSIRRLEIEPENGMRSDTCRTTMSDMRLAQRLHENTFFAMFEHMKLLISHTI